MSNLVAAVISFMIWTAVAVGVGWSERGSRAMEEVAKQQRADMDAYTHLELRYNATSADLQHALLENQNEKQVITKYVDRVVERPIYRSDCFDDDGLRLANAALLGRASLATGSNGTLPGANASGK